MGAVSSSPRITIINRQDPSSMLHHDFSDIYELGPEIGVGSFAAVHQCHRKDDPLQQFAVKIINKRFLSNKEMVGLRDEIAILEKVSHRNVIGLVDVFDDGKKVFMVLELCDGKDLFDAIVCSKNNQFTEHRAALIVWSLSNALRYLHSHGVVHRDLKPENILFGVDGTLKITDFGLAHSTWPGEGENVTLSMDGEVVMTTCCGTPHYVAPEIISKNEYTSKVDVWSLGVILFVMLVGYQPFNGESLPDIYKLIASGSYSFSSRRWLSVSKEAKQLIASMLAVDPKKRLDAAGVLSHCWIRKHVADSPQSRPSSDSLGMAELEEDSVSPRSVQ